MSALAEALVDDQAELPCVSLDFPPDEWEQHEADERTNGSGEPFEPRGDGSLHA